ncbi:MAG: hypothetical protein IPJ01_12880 [Micavibrio sp.]|nr:hypothetical protein [Micavibrio sp.]
MAIALRSCSSNSLFEAGSASCLVSNSSSRVILNAMPSATEAAQREFQMRIRIRAP